MVSSYLVHHGYCGTAEAFARATGQAFDEEISSIKNRQSSLLYKIFSTYLHNFTSYLSVCFRNFKISFNGSNGRSNREY